MTSLRPCRRQEKSLRTAEEQRAFEASTAAHLDEALAYLLGSSDPLSGEDTLQDIRSEVERVWRIRVVTEALQLPELGSQHLGAIETYLTECTAVATQLPADADRSNNDRVHRLSKERLLDCVSVAHAYVRERPEDWERFRAATPGGFAVIAKVAQLYGELE